MESDRQFSLHVSRALDCLGKSKDMAKFRVEQYNEEEQIRNRTLCGNIAIIAGSKGEGLTAPFENDCDIIHVHDDVICADNTAPFRNINDVTVFKADRRSTSPGYTKLRLDSSGEPFSRDIIRQTSLEYINGQLYCSSDFYFEIHQSCYARLGFNFNRRGPSHSLSMNYSSLASHNQDFVLAFLCSCPEIIESFITRPRNHNWPTDDQLIEILNMEGYVVPVGNKGSPTAFLEWRICYTKAERYLMRSLNDTLTKTYILLKMVSKTYISLVCGEITSYVLKNIVLWLTEGCNLDTFKEDLLVEILIQSLKFLRKCVNNNNLPSYMIPERNLFSGKLDLPQRQKMINLLTELIDKGGGLLFGCERLRGTMIVLYKEPARAQQYKCKRDVIEKLWLNLNNACLEKITTGVSLASYFTDEAYMNEMTILNLIVVPDFEEQWLQGHDPFVIFMTRKEQWLS